MLDDQNKAMGDFFKETYVLMQEDEETMLVGMKKEFGQAGPANKVTLCYRYRMIVSLSSYSSSLPTYIS